MLNQPLKCGIEGDELVIRIGIDTLKHATEYCPKFYDYEKEIKHKKYQEVPYQIVEDAMELAKDVSLAMQREEEDGSCPLSDFLDNMILDAYEDGSIGFKYDS